MEHFHEMFPVDSEKVPNEIWGIFRNIVLGMLNVGIFPNCSPNILRIFYEILYVDEAVPDIHSL